MSEGADPGFESVRTTLESALTLPFAVTISSSQMDDGKTELAVGTARAFARAGFSAVVVDAHPAFPGVGPALGVGELPLPTTVDAAELPIRHVEDNLDAVSIGSHKLLDGLPPAKAQAFVQRMRRIYQVTVVDTCDLFYDAFAVQCAAACDGVVLAIRYARDPDPEDDRVVTTLEKMGARIIGSVPTDYPAQPFGRLVVRLTRFSLFRPRP